MAYARRKSGRGSGRGSRNAAPARRVYSRSAPRKRATGGRKTRVPRQQTVRLVIEQVAPQSSVDAMQAFGKGVPSAPAKKAQF